MDPYHDFAASDYSNQKKYNREGLQIVKSVQVWRYIDGKRRGQNCNVVDRNPEKQKGCRIELAESLAEDLICRKIYLHCIICYNLSTRPWRPAS